MLFGFLDWISLFSAITGTKRVQNVNYILAKMAFPYAAHDWQIPMWPQESHVESMTESTNSQESTLRKVRQLRGEIRQVETASRNDDGSLIPSGSTAMDRLLPAGGYNRGTIVEWLADRGSSVDYLSLLGARNASADGGGVVIVDGQGDFYPPAARAMGIRLNNLVVLRSNEKGPRQWMAPGQSQALDQDDLCWAIDQSLRCNGRWLDIGNGSRWKVARERCFDHLFRRSRSTRAPQQYAEQEQRKSHGLSPLWSSRAGVSSLLGCPCPPCMKRCITTQQSSRIHGKNASICAPCSLHRK